MITGALLVLVVAGAVGSGLMAGAFFAFSAFVMTALDRLPPVGAVAAMQSINVVAVTPAFMLALMGTTAVCVVVLVAAVASWGDPSAAYLLAGSGLYLGGVFALTAAYHVPRNNALALVDPESPDAAELWATYRRDWTRWNHVRAVAALAAAAVFTIAIRVT